MDKMENYLEKQCLQQNEKSSIWIVKNSEENHETLINFTKSGNKPKSIDDIDKIVLFAIDITLALHEIHSINLIHGEISSNIIIESNKSNSCKLLYFADMPFSNLKINLPYMAPELLSHTCADSRADLYSLGVLLYKMSTGILPCFADETIEIVHQQLAQKPEPPSSINRSIPEPLSEIISKLLEKNPDKRYQTAYGLAQDLILLYKNLTTPGIKNSFHLAQFDIVPKLKFADKLYGRDTERQLLRDEIVQLQNGKFKIIKISGKAGVGKTSLVNEINDFRNKISLGFLKSDKVLTKIIPDLELLTGSLTIVKTQILMQNFN